MAKDDKPNINKKEVNGLLNFIQNNINKLYKNTFYTQPDNKLDLDTIKQSIDTSMDKITDNTEKNTGMANISQLYLRLGTPTGISGGISTNSNVTKGIENLFDDNMIADGLFLSNYANNRSLKEYDEEIDLICKYMPQLGDALDAKKDNVLSADHFSKDYIIVSSGSNVEPDGSFNERIKEIKKKYNLIELFDTLYDRTAKYGEQFVYVVPYNKALSKLLANKPDTNSNFMGVSESTITEAFNENKVYNEISKMDNSLKTPEKNTLKIELNMTGILESAIINHKKANRIIQEAATNEKIIKDDLSFEGIDGQESIAIPKDNIGKDDKINIKIPGCVVKIIPRENVIPVYIDNLCLGYYCIEHDSTELFSGSNSNIDPLMSFRSGKMKLQSEDNTRKDEILKYVSGELSKYIDAKFINANQDLSKEIYMILKGNDILNSQDTAQIKVTFVPPEDMVHFYFRKDLKTNRGISDLDDALLPAKLYTSLYISNVLGNLTRGYDKRVYYVKQNIETNISQTLLNVIAQIKKGNFGARELTNVKTILNVTGRYNDYVIPLGAGGDPPIQFEVMPGQNIEVKTDLMNILEQMAINATDVPYEYVQSRQTVDYAVRLTMSSGKFLRKTFKRQGQVELPSSQIMTKIYNAEYQENDSLEMNLPSPAFLNIMNTDQMFDNTDRYVQNIVDSEAANEPDEFKLAFTKKLKRYYLSTYVDYDAVEKIKEQTKMELKTELKNDQNNGM